MRSLARAIPYIISNPWRLALPLRRFSPTAPSPGAVLTTLDRCPLNIDLHSKISSSNWVRPVSSSQLPQRIIVNRGIFLRLYQTFGNMNQVPLPTQGRSNGVWDQKGDWRPFRTWRHCHQKDLDCNRIFYGWSWLQASGQRPNSSRLCPRSSELYSQSQILDLACVPCRGHFNFGA